MDTKIDPKFWNALKDFSSRLAEENDILNVSHHDADGITSCAVMVDLLMHLNKRVEFMTIKQLDSLTISKIEEKNPKTVVFTDMGSGQLEIIRQSNIKNYYVIDHHQPIEETPEQINPHFFGYDGGKHVSASGMAYLVAKALGHEKMAHIAIIGAVGDMEDYDGKMHSLNRLIMNDAINNGTLKVKHDLRLFGRQSRKLSQMLTYSSDPVLPGLTGNQRECARFIQNLGIELKKDDKTWKTYVDLTFAERKKLMTALYIHLLDLNTPEFVIQKMIGEVYTLLDEEKGTELRDAKEFSTILNACGRHDESDIGVMVCLGDRGVYLKKAKSLLSQHRRQLRKGLKYMTEKGVESLDNLYYFDSDGKIKESIIGVIAGMLYGARVIPPDKPVIALAEDKDDKTALKISSRANNRLVRAGIHLGEAMRDGSAAVGGEGGGHNIAAGARIPKVKRDEFLANIDKIFAEQLKKKGK